MTVRQKQITTPSIVAATLFISGCMANTMPPAAVSDKAQLCCLICAKPENGCKVYSACRHASPKLEMSSEKCTALGGLMVDAEK